MDRNQNQLLGGQKEDEVIGQNCFIFLSDDVVIEILDLRAALELLAGCFVGVTDKITSQSVSVCQWF